MFNKPNIFNTSFLDEYQEKKINDQRKLLPYVIEAVRVNPFLGTELTSFISLLNEVKRAPRDIKPYIESIINRYYEMVVDNTEEEIFIECIPDLEVICNDFYSEKLSPFSYSLVFRYLVPLQDNEAKEMKHALRDELDVLHRRLDGLER